MEAIVSRTSNSLKNMATGVFGQAVTLILQFIYRTVFIQILGVTYLSVNGLFTNILTIFSFAELGIGQAIIFGLYKPIRNNDIPKIQAYMELYRRIESVLSPYENHVWWLYLSGQTTSAIAASLNKDERSVQNAIYRIRKKLRVELHPNSSMPE